MTSLNDRFKLITGIESMSASSSDLWLIEDRFNGRQYIMKIFPDRLFKESKPDEIEIQLLNEKNNALFYELQMYLIVREKLIEPILVNCRNVLCIAGNGTFTVDEVRRFVASSESGSSLSRSEIDTNILYNVKYIMDLLPIKRLDNNNIEFPVRRSISARTFTSSSQGSPIDHKILNGEFLYECIITPKLGQETNKSLIRLCMNLKETLSKKKFVQELYNYLFLIICTIYVMAQNGFNQNDLHWGNILMDSEYLGENPKYKKKYFLILDSTLVLVHCEHTPFIFDFDRATYQRNSNAVLAKQPYFEKMGTCSEFHPQRDMLKFFCQTYHETRKHDIPIIPQDILSSNLIKEPLLSLFTKVGIENGQEVNCTFQTEGSISAACKKSTFTSQFASNNACVAWALQRCAFEQFNLKDLYSEKKIDNLYYLKKWFTEDLPANWQTFPDAVLKEYVAINTQFISPHQTRDLSNFVEFIVSKCIHRKYTISQKFRSNLKRTKSKMKRSIEKSKERFLKKRGK